MSSICVRCLRQVAAGVVECVCAFSKANSVKCDRCRDQRSRCVALPEALHEDALVLLTGQEDHLAGGDTPLDEVVEYAKNMVDDVDKAARAARSTVGEASSPIRPVFAAAAAPAPAPAAAAATIEALLGQLLAAQNQTNALLRELLRRIPAPVEEEEEGEAIEEDEGEEMSEYHSAGSPEL